MKNILEMAKIFLQSIKIIFIKTTEMDINYDPEKYTAYEVTITNPNNNKSLVRKTLIDNLFVNKKEDVGIYTKYTFLMETILDYLYKNNDKSYIRNQFSNVFNIEEIKLLIEYFSQLPNFKKTINELKSG